MVGSWKYGISRTLPGCCINWASCPPDGWGIPEHQRTFGIHIPIRKRTIMVTNMPTHTPLQQQIDEFLAEESNLRPPDLLKDLLSIIEQVITSGAAEKALKEGAQAPDFTLPDALGNAVTLSHLLRQGPVVMSFYRGAWCPYCNLELRAYQRVLPQLQELGATLVAISPQTPDHSLSTVENKELTFAVLSDVGNQVARAYRIVFTLEESIRPLYTTIGSDLPTFNTDATWDLTMRAT